MSRLWRIVSVMAVLAMLFGVLPVAAAPAIIPKAAGNPVMVEMTLHIPDPKMLVVVRAGTGKASSFTTFVSRPEGDTQLLPEGPYTFFGGNCRDKNILVFDAAHVLVGQSWWPGEQFTQYRAEGIPTGAHYWVLEQDLPRNWVNFNMAAVPAAGSLTLLVADPSLLVSVRDGDNFLTYYCDQPDGVTKAVETQEYTMWGGNCHDRNILVFDYPTRTLIGHSWWPGEPYTEYQANNVPYASGLLLVMGQKIPRNVR